MTRTQTRAIGAVVISFVKLVWVAAVGISLIVAVVLASGGG